MKKTMIAMLLLTALLCAACGTAAVASPIGEIDDLDNGTHYVIAKDGKPGPWTTKLYNALRGIQLGEVEDVHHWNTVL